MFAIIHEALPTTPCTLVGLQFAFSTLAMLARPHSTMDSDNDNNKHNNDNNHDSSNDNDNNNYNDNDNTNDDNNNHTQ